MPVTIGSNIASLGAQRQLSQGTDALGRVYERLSSGQRINRASDDAAGLAIASSLNADSRVFTQGLRNFNDGLSALNIADGALAELSNIVVRIKELAEQSANGVYSGKQRSALDTEAQALAKEFTRIQRTSSFNGLGLLNGASDGLRVQGGYGVAGSIAVGVGNFLGTGSFSDIATFATQTGSISGGSLAIASGDLNGDGILDLITAGYTNDGSEQGQASVLLGRADGTFGTKTTYATETGSVDGASYALSVVDINRDGILDLITAGKADNQGQASVRLGRGDGTFGAKTTYATDTDFDGGVSKSLTLGDLNGDGILDLVTAGYADDLGAQGQVSVLLGLGNGTFGTKITYATETGTSDGVSNAVTLGDLNGDGILDLVTAGNVDNGTHQGQASVRFGRGDGTFGTKVTYATETGSAGAASSAVTLGDLNGDGILDLVTAGYVDNGSSQGEASVRLGRSDGTFGAKSTFATTTGTTGHTLAVSLGDLNGDGILDLVTAGLVDNGNEQGQTSVLLGRGDGTFGAKSTYSTEPGTGIFGYSEDVTLGDINGDGILDIMTAGYVDDGGGGGQVSRLLGTSRSGVAPLLSFSLKTISGSRAAMSLMDQKLSLLSQQRGTIGASQSRIDIGSSALKSTIENYKAATSRITDADMAQEAAQLTRRQILQQAATSVLSQANQQPELAVRLLRG